MEEVKKTVCRECAFSINSREGVYECHRLPPSAVDRIHTLFPECKPDWWCAEGVRKESANTGK